MGRPRRVLVVGGGAAGVLTATALLRQAATSRSTAASAVDVTVVERSEVVGPGLAYATSEPRHLLNNYAGRMSALEDDPAHLVRWCRARGMPATSESFLTRGTYGHYLADLLGGERVPRGSAWRVVQDEVLDVADAGTGYLASTASGTVLSADVVVLALGNPPPRAPRGLAVPPGRLVVNPWAPGLLERVRAADRVLLVGTGLTMVDVAAQIGAARPGVRMTATSRHGLLPLRHVPAEPGHAAAFDGDVRTVRSALRDVRRGLEHGVDWRDLVESLKVVANDMWGGLSAEDRERFTRHVSRHWEIARHRMAPAMAAIVDDLLASGRLTVTSGAVDPAPYDLVVSCTGPAPVSSTGWNPLVDSLVGRCVLRPGPLGLGVAVDADGALLDADGVAARGIYALGAARRGMEWEVAAVPDLRRQALRLGQHLAATHVPPPVELAG